MMDDVAGVAHSSSDELLESEDDDADESSSPCSGSGCLAPRAWDVSGRHPELISTGISR